MSIVKANQWQNSSGAVYHSLLQVATGSLTQTLTTSTGGDCVITAGVQIFSFSFTPKKSTSKLILQTCPIAIAEENNNGNQHWLAAFNGSTLIASYSGTPIYTAYGNNLNVIFAGFNHQITNWGTSAATISIRAGSFGTSLMYINGQSYDSTGQGSRNTISYTLLEVDQ